MFMKELETYPVSRAIIDWRSRSFSDRLSYSTPDDYGIHMGAH